MEITALLPSLALISVLAAAGIYLALPRDPEPDRPYVRRVGWILSLLGLVLLAAWSVAPVDGWEDSQLAAGGTAILVHALAGGGAVFAGGVVLARTSLMAVVASVLMLLAQAEILVFLGAPLLGVATVALPGTALMAACLFLVSDDGPRRERGDGGHEPLLACLAGALLATAIIAAVRHACTVEAGPTGAPSELPHWRGAGETAPDYRLLNLTLVLAAVEFALGGIGFLARRPSLIITLSAGLMLQGVVLTTAAFGSFHGNVSGEVLALAALGLVLLQGILVTAATVRQPPADERGGDGAGPHAPAAGAAHG